MRKTLILLILLLIFSFLSWLSIGHFRKTTAPRWKPEAIKQERQEDQENKKNYENFHFSYFLSKEFYGDLEKTEEIKLDKKIYGGIVSHHFFVSPKIAEFFASFKNQKPKTIVIIGPNHFNLGDSDILVSKYPHKTPWGILEPNEEIINELLKTGFIKNEELPFEREHSISTLVGFIKYFLPETKILPIVLKRNTSPQKAESLALELNKILQDNDLVLASVDFSHHLNRIAAQFHDEISISVIKSFDYGRIYNLEIDSPPSIYTLLKYLEKKEAQKMIYENTNSAIFSNNLGLEDVTSYLLAYFIKGLPEREEKISILNFGDMMLDREIKKTIENNKDPFEKIKGEEGNFLRGVDFISGNLEGPITDKIDCPKKEISFKFSPKTAKLLFENKINLVNLANNHSFDCGQKGVDDTKKYLDNFRIGYFGGGNRLENSYTIREIGNKKIVFLGIDETIRPIKIDNFYQLIKKLKEENDYIIVNIHWGIEYSKKPSSEQIKIAHKLIDDGVDIIVGHHPHVVQPIEIYKNKHIFYSLGNFIFDQMSKETNTGFGVGTILSETGNEFYVFPYEITEYQPTLMPYKRMEEFCSNFLSGIKTKDTCRF